MNGESEKFLSSSGVERHDGEKIDVAEVVESVQKKFPEVSGVPPEVDERQMFCREYLGPHPGGRPAKQESPGVLGAAQLDGTTTAPLIQKLWSADVEEAAKGTKRAKKLYPDEECRTTRMKEDSCSRSFLKREKSSSTITAHTYMPKNGPGGIRTRGFQVQVAHLVA